MTQQTATLRRSRAALVAARSFRRASQAVLSLATAGSPGRDALENRIRDVFSKHYGASIEHFLPLLLSLDLDGQSGAIAGLRPAASGRLFLEQYLDQPVEQAISRALRVPVDRDRIVEIGNLVSLTSGAAAALFGLLAVLLNEAGIRWVACTATPQVREMLAVLEFPAVEVCAANPASLGEDQAAWGSYYASRPTVIVGDARIAAEAAARHPAVASMRRALGREFDAVVTALRGAA